jgi:hypothetical protein
MQGQGNKVQNILNLTNTFKNRNGRNVVKIQIYVTGENQNESKMEMKEIRKRLTDVDS